ncbi:MAG: hypothetical protein II208_00405 [Alphaproteobacteria bacterium]|nr:hypothetical protein [Alphaproteobacteria bacterium]
MTCCTDTQPTNSIVLTQGDDSNALGGSINFNLTSTEDMTGWYAILQLENFQWRYNDLTNGGFEWVVSREISSQLEIGLHYAAMKVFDAAGLCKTVINDIPVYVNQQTVANPGA